MAINGVVQYNTSGFLPYILLFTQATILVWFDGTIIDIIFSTILLQCTTTVVVMLGYDWWLCIVINISVQQYNGGFLLDIILLTQCYYHRGTHLNAVKRFCICSL